MLFSELYGVYYHTVSQILAEALNGKLSYSNIEDIVRKNAFDESILTIPNALKRQDWPLLDDELHTPLLHSPGRPLSTLEKRWLKSLLSDPRIALFSPSAAGLEDVSPLFSPDDFVWFDRCEDGDPYSDPAYIEVFQTILHAIRDRRSVLVRFRSASGNLLTFAGTPVHLEYSEKDDKFRLIAVSLHARRHTINLARVLSCTPDAPADTEPLSVPEADTDTVTFLLRDRRNALERVMLHFSHFEKETARLDKDLYRVTVRCDRADEAELIIRLLSFGPMIKVTAPEELKAKIKQRIDRQLC